MLQNEFIHEYFSFFVNSNDPDMLVGRVFLSHCSTLPLFVCFFVATSSRAFQPDDDIIAPFITLLL